MHIQHPLSGAELTDEALLAAVREGDLDSFGTLYERYYGMARSIAYRHTGDSVKVDDLVSEAFARILQAIKNGKGPRSYMGGYLSTTLAHLAGEYGLLAAREVPSEQEHLESMGSLDETVLKRHESDEVVSAFTSLPERWQTVLWMTEVEAKKPREIAAAMNLSANAVSALTIRARESLREGFLRAHQSAPHTKECDRFHSFISPYVRGSLSQKRSDALRTHFESCNYCTSEYLSLVGINKSMRSWIFPVLAGLGLWSTDGAALLAPAAISTTASGALLAGAGSGSGSSTGTSTLAASPQFSLVSPLTWGTGAQLAAGTAAVAAATVAVVGGTIIAQQNTGAHEVLADGYNLTLPSGTQEPTREATSLGAEYSAENTAGWNASAASQPRHESDAQPGVSLQSMATGSQALGSPAAGAISAPLAEATSPLSGGESRSVEPLPYIPEPVPVTTAVPDASVGSSPVSEASITATWVDPTAPGGPIAYPSNTAQDRDQEPTPTATAQPSDNRFSTRSIDPRDPGATETPTPDISEEPTYFPTKPVDELDPAQPIPSPEPTDDETEWISDQPVPEWYGTADFTTWFYSVRWDDIYRTTEEVPTNKQCTVEYRDWDAEIKRDEVYLPVSLLNTVYTNYVFAGFYGVPVVHSINCAS